MVRDIFLSILPFNTIETKSLEHWLVIKAVEVHRLARVSKMLILIPRRNAKRIVLLPVEPLAIDLCIAAALNDMVY